MKSKSYTSEANIGIVKAAVKKVVLKRSKDLKILDITVKLKDDPYSDDYDYWIEVIYDDKAGRPKKGLTLGLNSAVRRELEEHDLDLFPVFQIIPKSEYKALKTAAA